MTEGAKKLFDLGTGRQRIENLDYLFIAFSAVMVCLGIALGTVVPGLIILSVLGSFFVMAGIAAYLLLQLRD